MGSLCHASWSSALPRSSMGKQSTPEKAEEDYGQPGARLAGAEKPRQLKARLGLEFLGSKPPVPLTPEAA